MARPQAFAGGGESRIRSCAIGIRIAYGSFVRFGAYKIDAAQPDRRREPWKEFRRPTGPHQIDLGVAEREVVCVIGPSGSGKTTLLRCMALLEATGEGHVRMAGDVIAVPAPDRVVRQAAKRHRADIGMVFQQFNLWPHMTALQNVAEAPMRVRKMERGAATELAASLLEKVGMASAQRRLSGPPVRRPAAARRHRPRSGDGAQGPAV